MSAKQSWDAELYEARHGFVWQFGEGVLELLKPQLGERILDLGCGPGQLTYKIAEAGANVLGLDSSPEMIGQARQNYPALAFALGDAAAMQYQNEFDAVFSNAALHWMLDSASVARAIAASLRISGRLVAELGGKGNIAQIHAALQSILPAYSNGQLPAVRTFFPSLGEYSALLEAAGLEVQFAHLFDRPTPLEGERGMENWLHQFSWYSFDLVQANQREQAMREVVSALRPALFRDGHWKADYRRLRIVAVKL